MRYKKLILNVEHDPKILQMFQKLVKIIPNIPMLDKLIDDATENGTITVDFENNGKCPTSGSLEMRDKDGWVKIEEGNPFSKIFSILIASLFSFKSMHSNLHNPAVIPPQNFSQADDFARAMEIAVYYGTYQPKIELLNDILNNKKALFIENNLDIFDDEFNDLIKESANFDEFWSIKNTPVPGKTSSHADAFREHYERTLGRTYTPAMQLGMQNQKDTQTTIRYKNLTINTGNDPEIARIAKALITLMPKIPALNKLIDEATQYGNIPIKVDFIDKNECPSGNGICERGKEINIKVVKEAKHFSEMLAVLVVELCNANNPYFDPFSPSAVHLKEYASVDDFAFAMETTEYHHTFLPAKNILEEISTHHQSDFEKMGLDIFDGGISKIKDKYHSLADWLGKHNELIPNKSYSHTDIFRKFHEDLKKSRNYVSSHA